MKNLLLALLLFPLAALAGPVYIPATNGIGYSTEVDSLFKFRKGADGLNMNVQSGTTVTFEMIGAVTGARFDQDFAVGGSLWWLGTGSGNGGGISNAVDLIAGPGITVTPGGLFRNWTITATGAGSASNNVWATVPGRGALINSNAQPLVDFSGGLRIETNYIAIGEAGGALFSVILGASDGLHFTDRDGSTTNIFAKGIQATVVTNISNVLRIGGTMISNSTAGVVAADAAGNLTNFTALAGTFTGAMTSGGTVTSSGIFKSSGGTSVFNTTGGTSSASGIYQFTMGGGTGMTDSSGRGIGLNLKPVVQMSSTAGYSILRIDATLNSIGSGESRFVDFGNSGNTAQVLTNGDFQTAGLVKGTNGLATFSRNKLAPLAIAVGASPFSFTNSFGTNNITIYVDGAGVTGSVGINGATVFSALAGADLPLTIQPGEWITVTYTIGTPVMNWKPF